MIEERCPVCTYTYIRTVFEDALRELRLATELATHDLTVLSRQLQGLAQSIDEEDESCHE